MFKTNNHNHFNWSILLLLLLLVVVLPVAVPRSPLISSTLPSLLFHLFSIYNYYKKFLPFHLIPKSFSISRQVTLLHHTTQAAKERETRKKITQPR